mmetsp:Transcript_2242/g.4709  ORF Transcript_2242/g.4709 Transcript_2242/m.4709 type:complete len:201 (+) Transcript_2242:55-657(+)
MGRRQDSRSCSGSRSRGRGGGGRGGGGRSRSRRGGGGGRRGDSRGRGGGGAGSKRSGNSRLERFIDENELNEAAASRLRTVTTEVQERVIDQGWNVIDNSRNASAVVISRIRKHEQLVAEGRSASPPRNRGRDRGDRERSRDRGGGRDEREVNFKEGDWMCDSCGAHNFARREECFKCGAPKSGKSRGGSDRRRDSRDRR